MVAKSYQDWATYGEPFEENKRMYIVVVTPRGAHKKVRWYSDAEYAKMYPQDGVSANPLGKKIRSTKDVLGFSKGYITIFKGDTYPLLEWFQESSCRFHSWWGWYLVSEEEEPQWPAGTTPVQLKWEDVAIVDEDTLKSETLVRQAVDALLYEESPSEFQGEVGDRIDRTLTVVKVTPLEDGYYGPSTFFLFRDEYENEYCWTTGSKSLDLGEAYDVRGTIKALQTYKGKKQTVLTRCRVN